MHDPCNRRLIASDHEDANKPGSRAKGVSRNHALVGRRSRAGRPNPDRIRPNLGRVRPMLAKFWSNAAGLRPNLRRIRPSLDRKLPNVGRILSKFGRSQPKLNRSWSSDKIWHKFCRHRPGADLAEIGPDSPISIESGADLQIRASANTCYMFDRERQTLVELEPHFRATLRKPMRGHLPTIA